MDNFNLETAQNLGLPQAKEYITKYFVPLTDGNHAMLLNGEFVIKDDTVIKKTYFSRLSKEINHYYFKEYAKIRTIVYKLNKDIFFDDKLNLCPQMKHKYVEYKTFDTTVKSKVDMLLNLIFEIWCNGKKDMYDFVLVWLANMLKGNKNQSCLYLKGIQGIGKSTIFNFLKEHVLGDLYLETGSRPLTSEFNLILGGKLLVCFEELENFGIQSWSNISSKLKRYITSDTMNFEGKGTNAYDGENINNYALLSNNDAIRDDEGRRYCTLDVSTKRLGDKQYFSDIHINCFNDIIGKAFFCYLMEISTDKFDSQGYPNTENKLDSFAKRLDSSYQFIKDCYILQKKNIFCTVQELHDEYKEFCLSKTIKAHHKIDFNKSLKTIGIVYYVCNSTNKYKVSYEDLLKIGNKFHWIHSLDEFVKSDVELTTQKTIKDNTDENIKSIKEENEKLKKQLEEYKKLLETPTVEIIKQPMAIEMIPVLDDDISVLTTSTSSSKKKQVNYVKFKAEKFTDMSYDNFKQYLESEGWVYSKEGTQRAYALLDAKAKAHFYYEPTGCSHINDISFEDDTFSLTF